MLGNRDANKHELTLGWWSESEIGGAKGRDVNRAEDHRKGDKLSPGVTPLGAVGELSVGEGVVQGSKFGGSVEVGMGRWEGRQEKGPPSCELSEALEAGSLP